MVDEDKPVTFSAVNNTLISVTDVDLAESADNSMDVTIVANNGTFRLFTTAGLVSSAGDGTGNVTLRGNVAASTPRWTVRSSRPEPHFNGPTTIQVTVNDRGNTGADPSQGGVNVIRVINLRFNAENDIPNIVVNPVTVDTTEDVAGGLNIQAIQVNDPDVSETPGGELLVTLRVSHGTLTVRDNLGTLFVKPGDISGNGTGTVVLAASPAEINNTLAAAGGLIYQPNPQYFGQDILLIDANDQGLSGFGGQGLDQDRLTINVASVNDPPRLIVPSAKSMQEDGTLFLSGISVTDEDAGSASIQVTLSVSKGTLLVATDITGGISNVPNNGAATVTLKGTMAEINATLAAPSGLKYTPNANASGPDDLVVLADDLGNFGGTNNQSATDTKTVRINIAPVNDAPRVAVPAVQPLAVDEDTNLTNLGVTVTDVDATEGTGQVRVTATVANGTLTVSTQVPNGVPSNQILNNGSSSLIMTGTPDQLNATLTGDATHPGLTYLGQLNFFGTDC